MARHSGTWCLLSSNNACSLWGVHSLRERFVVHYTDFRMRVFGVRKIHKGKSLATVPYVFRDFSSWILAPIHISGRYLLSCGDLIRGILHVFIFLGDTRHGAHRLGMMSSIVSSEEKKSNRYHTELGVSREGPMTTLAYPRLCGDNVSLAWSRSWDEESDELDCSENSQRCFGDPRRSFFLIRQAPGKSDVETSLTLACVCLIASPRLHCCP